MGSSSIARALISTSDKSQLVEFATQLNQLNIEIIATGGTAKLLREHDIPVIDVADITGFPELLNGRVKTLHPNIHAGLLARRGIDDDTMSEHALPWIDLVVVNLYPFQETIARPDCSFEDAIEKIDIGGPTMLRAAAKNHHDVTVVVDPNDYPTIIDTIKKEGNTSLEQRRRLAAKTFTHTADYDTAISQYFKEKLDDESIITLPKALNLSLSKSQDLRYGENPHQAAALYVNGDHNKNTLAQATLLQGKPLSFNNLIDSEAAMTCVRWLDSHLAGCVIIKHATPCGAAQAKQLIEAYQNAYATDPSSAFGGIIAFNRELDAKTAETVLQQQFVEVIIAPTIHPEALTILSTKPNLRVLCCNVEPLKHDNECSLHSIGGGVLMQQLDEADVDLTQLIVKTDAHPTKTQLNDLLFAWRVVRNIKSNAIVYAKDLRTLGIGSGQTSRVFSTKIAILKAQEATLNLDNAVMASDAFFPFADSIEIAADAGIKAIIQPGGSKRDEEVIAAANAAGIAMVFTGMRHFKH